MPSLGIDRIKAKIDTGARTSSIHAFDVQTTFERGAPHVTFNVSPMQRRRKPVISCLAEIHDERVITSSSGHRQERYVIKVEIGFGTERWPIELTLANRDLMGFRMLLGREALRGRFLVNPSKSYILGKSRALITRSVP